MNEADIRLRLRHALEQNGCDVVRQDDCVVCPKCHTKIIPERGRADLTASPTRSTYYIEVKILHRNDTSFSFSSINGDQRTWLDEALVRGARTWLGLGVVRPAGSRSRLEALYLIPWFVWEMVEELTRARYEQESLPWIAGKGFSTKMQEDEWDIRHLLEPCRMVKADGKWRLPSATSAVEKEPECQTQ